MNRWLDEQRHQQIRDQLRRNRKQMRALAEARCPNDSRLLGAVYRLPDGYWLWHVGERMTPEQEHHERLAMAALEYDTLVEHGTDAAEAWDMVLPDPDSSDTEPRAGYSDHLIPLGDPAKTYASTTVDQLRTRLPGNEFCTCGTCRRTYIINYVVMQYAAGQAIHTRTRKPVIVHPGRVVPVDASNATDGPAYGIQHPWRPTPWTILGSTRTKDQA